MLLRQAFCQKYAKMNIILYIFNIDFLWNTIAKAIKVM